MNFEVTATTSTTTPTQKVSVEEVRHIAELSNLHLTAAEETTMQRDLNAILNYVAELNELDTSAVVPMAQVKPQPGCQEEDSRAVLRQDTLVPSLDRNLVMGSAPETDGVFFKVPKVIER
jgi:aspartyl-tRNA(Asn)/glutamyl-tRNA(Gln) amidotransferase subunit C